MNRYELSEKLIEDGWSIEDVDTMSDFELFDAWLESEGIMGYSYDIIDMISTIWNVDLMEE